MAASLALTWSNQAGLSDLDEDQQIQSEIGEDVNIVFTVIGTAVDVTTWTLAAMIAPDVDSSPYKAWIDSDFGSKTSAGLFTLSVAVADTSLLPGRNYFLEIRRVDSGFSHVISKSFWTLSPSPYYTPVTPPAGIVTVLQGGTGADLSATGPGIVIQPTAGGALTILGDAGADKIAFWDDSESVPTWLTVGSGLSITGTTLSATDSYVGTVTSVSVVDANGVSGSVATATTTPAITLALGAITPTSVNGLTITTTTGTLTLANAKTLTVNNTLTLTGTDGSTLAIGTGGTLGSAAYTASSAYDAAGSAATAQAASQPSDATLTALAALTIAANSLSIGTGADAFAQTAFAANTFPARASTGNLVAKSISDFALTILDDADGPAVRTTIGAGTSSFSGSFSALSGIPTTLAGYGIADAQPFDATLAALAGMSTFANGLIIGTGVDAVAMTSFGTNTFPARGSTGDLVARQITDFGLSLVDDANAAAARTTLELGTLATQSGTFSGTSSGDNTGDQTSVTGNAGTATALQTARNIFGNSFNGTGNIGGTLTGGTATTSTLTLRSTSGVGESGADIIFAVGNAGDTEAGRILNSGAWTIATLTTTNQLQVAAGAASTIAQIIKLASAPSAHALDVNSSSGSGGDLAYINQTGGAFFAGTLGVNSTSLPGQAQITNSNASQVALFVKGAASQISNIQEWLNSSNVAVCYVKPSGDIRVRDTLDINNYQVTHTIAGGELYLSGSPTGATIRLGGSGRGDYLIGSIQFYRNNGVNATLFIDSAGKMVVGQSNSASAQLHVLQPVLATGSPTAFLVAGGAHTTLTASTEAIDVNLNLARTVQFATGALTTQRAIVVQAPTYAFVGTSTLTTAATLAVTGAPVAGTNATITNPLAFWVQAGSARFDSNTVVGNAALATNATNGFLYISSCSGTPTGTPTTFTGTIPIVYDSTNDIIYVYRSGWKKATANIATGAVTWV